MTYAPVKDEIQLEVLLNDTSTAKYGIAARNPAPMCIAIMMGIPMSMCVQMSNIGIQGDNLNMCMDFMVRLASSDIFEMHFQCMQMGLQGFNWVGKDGQPVIPSNNVKIQDKSTNESDEYYDENAAGSAENEVVSKEEVEQTDKGVIKYGDNVDDEADSNKAEEEMDYNDITEKILETVSVNEKENKTINSEEVSKEKPASQVNEVEYNIVPVNLNSNEGLETETQTNFVKQESSEINETATDHVEVQQAENMGTMEDKLNFEMFPTDQIKLSYGEYMENTSQDDVQTENSTSSFKEPIRVISEVQDPLETEEFMTFSNIEKMPLTTEPNYNEGEAQSIEKFEMLVNGNEIQSSEMTTTEYDANSSLEIVQQAMHTSTEYSVAENFKPTFTATVNITSTNSEIGNDSIDNALTTALTITSTTQATTNIMKMPYLSAAENPHVPVTLNESFNRHNESNTNGEGDDDNIDINSHDGDNSHENDSDYDDEESEEYEDETTEKAIETNDVTTIKNSMPIATNVLENNKKIIEYNTTTQITTKDENDMANAESSNESISDDENKNDAEEEDDSKDVPTESDEYEDEEYEDSETTTVAATDSTTIALLNNTHNVNVDKSNSTNEAHMSHANTQTITKDSNTLDVETTSSRMPPLSVIASSNATATTTETNAIAAMTTAMPLPLARQLFAFHQHKQRQYLQQQRQHQRHTYSRRYRG